MRDLSGNLESRLQLLNVKPNTRANWTSLAVAHHLCGNLDTAVQVCQLPRLLPWEPLPGPRCWALLQLQGFVRCACNV